MAKKFLDRLSEPNFTFNLVTFSLVVFMIILCLGYAALSWKTPDKIYQIIINIVSLILGLIGGKSLAK